MTLIPRRPDTITPPPHIAVPAPHLDSGRFFARCSSCDWVGDPSEALADSEGHVRASRFGRLR